MSESSRQNLADMRAFIGPKSDYYLSELAKSEREGGKVSFNWAAFFVSVGWVLYRRMYQRALILFAAFEAAQLVLYFLLRLTGVGSNTFSDHELWSGLDRITSLVAAVLCGLLGNRWYLEHVAEKISALPHSEERTAERAQAVGNAGQVSVTHAILGSIALIAVALFLEYLLKIPN